MSVAHQQHRHAQQVFTRRVRIVAPVRRAFAAIAMPEGLRGWWTPLVEGSAEGGGQLRFEFEGLTEHILMRVDAVVPPTAVHWTCLVHSSLPEWAGTRVLWSFTDLGDDACELQLSHVGLTPDLECFESCRAGWDHFLASIVDYVERRVGAPYRA